MKSKIYWDKKVSVENDTSCSHMKLIENQLMETAETPPNKIHKGISLCHCNLTEEIII
jgi:hypothetical protein